MQLDQQGIATLQGQSFAAVQHDKQGKGIVLIAASRLLHQNSMNYFILKK